MTPDRRRANGRAQTHRFATEMNELRRHLIFVGLIAGYVAVVLLTGRKLRLFSSRFGGGMGIDIFALSAWCACYWRGPYSRGVLDPYPHRSVAILLGVVGMIGALGLKMARELG